MATLAGSGRLSYTTARDTIFGILDPKSETDLERQVQEKDPDGRRTVTYLKKVRSYVDVLTGNGPASLGIHPVVYCYTRGGEFQPAALLATADFIKKLADVGQLPAFTLARRKVEDFLLNHKEFITLTIKRTGAGRRSQPRLGRYLEFLLEQLSHGKSDSEVVSLLESASEFAYLLGARGSVARDGKNPTGRLSRSTKSASFLQAATQNPVRCVCVRRRHLAVSDCSRSTR